jgi:hypothetical protein
VARLLAAGWFNVARKVGTARAELSRIGADPGGGGALGGILSDFVRDGFLTREGEGFIKAAGCKVSVRSVTVND